VSPLRERLAVELATKVERHGVVIWDDPDGSYAGVVGEVVPEGAVLQKFDGSWFDLRFRLEKLLVGQSPPAVVTYVDSRPSDPDPLEELRAVGTRFRIALSTLVRATMGGQLSENRLVQIGRQCTTIGEAEAAIGSGESGLDARLVTIIGESSAPLVAAALVAGTHESDLAVPDLVDAAQRTLADAIGGAYDGLEGLALRHAAFRHVVLSLVADAIGALPDELSASTTTATQRKACAGVLERLQFQTELHNDYLALAEGADQQLHLGALLGWDDALGALDATPVIESIALGESFRRLEESDEQGALDLAEQRLASSWWVKPLAPGGEVLATKYRAVQALAQMGLTVMRPVPEIGSISAVRDWYSNEGWQVDAAYRRAELVRVTSGAALDELDELFHRARQNYEAWLDRVLEMCASALTDSEVPAAVLQRSIHTTMVANGSQRTAYVLVDALRYELGVDLADRLRTVNADVELTAAVGTPPSITKVGMAAVLPKADTEFHVALGPGNRLEVVVGGSAVGSVRDRVRLLEHAHGSVVDLVLDDVAQFSNRELKKKLGDSSLVLVRSTEIDSDGESDQLAASWGSFDTTLNVLQTAIAKLIHAGIQRIVVTADHGFLAVRQLGEDRRIDKPSTGVGEQHRRAWIGRGGTASDSTVRIPLSAFGISGDLDIITPRGLGVFTSGGGLQFFHGGLSPQELIVPVIVCTAEDVSPDPQYRIELSVAGERITTGVVAVTVRMTGDLFTRESRVRLQLTQDKERVATVVGGDGFDPATGTIDATVDSSRVITLQIAADLLVGSTAMLEVLDAATGVRLESMAVEVGANVIVEDHLD